MNVGERMKYPESGGAYRRARYRVRLSDGKRMTQERLAAAVGIDRTYINKIERGKHRPGPDLRDRIADALRVDPTTLPAGADPFAPTNGSRTSLVESLVRRLKRR